MADEPRDPLLEDVLDRHAEVILERVRTQLPGQITSYDAASQTASAQPLVQERRLAEDGETLTTRPLPATHRCPVLFPGNARGRITWPVAAGDTCLIWYCGSSIARWVALGGLTDPADDRHHDLSDAVVIVGGHDAAHVPTDAPTDAVVLHANGGVTIKLGSSGASQHAVGDHALLIFGQALNAAITTLGANPAAAALAALRGALGIDPSTGLGWTPGTTKVLVE